MVDFLSRKDINFYSAGSLGTGLYSTVPSVLLLYFCTEVLIIPAAIAGIIVFVPKAWAVFWDPVVGRWSDGCRHHWGRRRPFLLAGLLGMVCGFVGLFSPPELSWHGSAIWVAVFYFSLATLYSLYAVPYIALPAQLGETEVARASLIGRRMVVVMLGVLAGAAGAPFLVDMFGGGRSGYRLMAIVLSGICLTVMSLPILMLRGRDHPSEGASAQIASLSQGIRTAAVDPHFRNLVLSFLLQLTAIGALLSELPYLVTRTLQRPEGDIAVALAALLVAAMVGVPTWIRVARSWGARTASIVATLGFGVATCIVGAVATQGLAWGTLLCSVMVAGLFFAGLQVLPFTAVAHHIRETAPDAEATLTGLWTATEKVGLAAGAALTAAVLSRFGAAGPGLSAAIALAALGLCAAAAILLSRIPAEDIA